MPKPIVGLHHVTAIASDPQRNVDFYTQVMGLRLVKRTINFDDPGMYHFYFGDDTGSPGTVLSFFYWPIASRGIPGIGETSAVLFSVTPTSLDYWEKRLAEAGISVQRLVRFEEGVLCFADPDGMCLEIVGHADARAVNVARTADVPEEHAIRGLFGVTLSESSYERTAAVLVTMGYAKIREDAERFRFLAPGPGPAHFIDLHILPQSLIPSVYQRGLPGHGSVHHIAFRIADDAAQLDWRTVLVAASHDATPLLDRIYFQAIYFREPGGVLFELVTDTPGFTLDEPPESLGESLKLPPWMEPQRARVERLLPPVRARSRRRHTLNRDVDPHRNQPVLSRGAALENASAVIILLHGRGASAEDILGLTNGAYHQAIAYLAPQAAGHRWYPYSFLAPLTENEPWLSSALARVDATIDLVLEAGIPHERIVVGGFSQGACVATEFVARNPGRCGGLVAFTGGLIGPLDMDLHHDGDLAGMPAWFSSGDPDPHVPWSRVEASAEQFAKMGAEVHTRRMEGRPHVVLAEELAGARALMLRQLSL